MGDEFANFAETGELCWKQLPPSALRAEAPEGAGDERRGALDVLPFRILVIRLPRCPAPAPPGQGATWSAGSMK